jgi:hypothetical protein
MSVDFRAHTVHLVMKVQVNNNNNSPCLDTLARTDAVHKLMLTCIAKTIGAKGAHLDKIRQLVGDDMVAVHICRGQTRWDDVVASVMVDVFLACKDKDMATIVSNIAAAMHGHARAYANARPESRLTVLDLPRVKGRTPALLCATSSILSCATSSTQPCTRRYPEYDISVAHAIVDDDNEDMINTKEPSAHVAAPPAPAIVSLLSRKRRGLEGMDGRHGSFHSDTNNNHSVILPWVLSSTCHLRAPPSNESKQQHWRHAVVPIDERNRHIVLQLPVAL